MNRKEGKKEHITYPVFTKAANDIKAEGSTPSVRLIREKIGGSNSTLLNYLQQWRRELALASTLVEDDISDAFRQALLAEFGRVVKSNREKLEAEIKQEQEQSKETNQLLQEAESKIVSLEDEFQAHQEQSTNTILNLERQVAASKERGLELERQIEKLERNLKESIGSQELAKIETAKAHLQLERADQTVEKLDKKLEMLEKKLSEAREQIHEAQMRAAVAETKAMKT